MDRRLSAGPVAVALALAVGCGLVIAACGSSAPSRTSTSSRASTAVVTPTAYVTALCRALAPFEQDVAAHSRALKSSSSTTAGRGKTELVGYLGALSTDADAAVAKLARAGVPRVRGGGAYAHTILFTFTRLDTAMSRAKQLAATLPTTSPIAFHSAATKLATAVKDSLGDLGHGLNSESNRTLDQDAAKQPACHSL
jgi:hypothetical protein